MNWVFVTETWLRPGECCNNLMAHNYSFFRMNRSNARIGGWTLLFVAERYEAREGRKLHT